MAGVYGVYSRVLKLYSHGITSRYATYNARDSTVTKNNDEARRKSISDPTVYGV